MLKLEAIEKYKNFFDNESGDKIRDAKTGEWISEESEEIDSELVRVWV